MPGSVFGPSAALTAPGSAGGCRVAAHERHLPVTFSQSAQICQGVRSQTLCGVTNSLSPRAPLRRNARFLHSSQRYFDSATRRRPRHAATVLEERAAPFAATAGNADDKISGVGDTHSSAPTDAQHVTTRESQTLTASELFGRGYRVPQLPRKYDMAEVDLYFAERGNIVVKRFAGIGALLTAFAASLAARRARSLISSLSPDASGPSGAESDARATVTLLTRLGPTFIKMGQVLATREDIVGPALAAELSALQDAAPPFRSDVAREIIREELGKDPEEVFEYMSQEPVASASLGQVYLARLRSTSELVAVKVQRPGALESVALDVHLLRRILVGVGKVAGMSRDLGEIADVVGEAIFEELDYECEARNTEEFSRVHSFLPGVKAPRVLWTHTTQKVLVTTWVKGLSPKQLVAILRQGSRAEETRESRDDASEGLAAGATEGVVEGAGEVLAVAADKDALERAAAMGSVPVGLSAAEEAEWARERLLRMVRLGVNCSLTQLMRTGIMHADPHPGNLLMDDDGDLVYLDLGMLTRVSDKHRLAMLTSFVHIVFGEWRALADDLAEMDLLKEMSDRDVVADDLRDSFMRYCPRDDTGAFDLLEMSYVDVTRALGRAALKHKFRLPPYYTLVVRSLGTLEGVAAAADPSFRIYRAALPALLRLIAQDSRPRAREVLLAMVRRELKRGSGAAEEDDGTLVQERSGARATQLMRVLASREASGARRDIIEKAGVPALVAALAGPMRKRLLAMAVSLAAGALVRALPVLAGLACRQGIREDESRLNRVERRRLKIVAQRVIVRAIADVRALPTVLNAMIAVFFGVLRAVLTGTVVSPRRSSP